MEKEVNRGRVRTLGVSNVNEHQLRELLRLSTIKPEFIQRRTFASDKWDAAVRTVSKEFGVIYQGYSLLTANSWAMSQSSVMAAAVKREITPAQLVFRFALDLGMAPITGSTSREHLVQDLAMCTAEPLTRDESDAVATAGAHAPAHKRRRGRSKH